MQATYKPRRLCQRRLNPENLMGRFSTAVSSFGAPFLDILWRDDEAAASRARLAEAADRAPVGIVVVKDGVVTDINRKGLALGGFERREEVVGKPFVNNVAPAYRHLLAEWNRLRVLGEPVPNEYFMMALRRNGTQFPFRASVLQAALPEGAATIIYFDDTTEQPEAGAGRGCVDGFETAGRLAISLAEVRAGDDMYVILAERLKVLTGAETATVAIYEPETSELVMRHFTFAGPKMKALGHLIGKRAEGLRIPLGHSEVKMLTTELIRRTNDISDLSFGIIPRAASALAGQLFGLGEAVGCALLRHGSLTGTITLTMPHGRPAPAREVLLDLSKVAADALCRWRLERAAGRVSADLP
jgi:PAS domain S-box-containing protein